MDTNRVREALKRHNGKVDEAAATLGTSRRTLDRAISKHGLGALRAPLTARKRGGAPRGTGHPKGTPNRVQTIDPDRRVRVERECDATGEFISLKDARGTMVTIKFSPCDGNGSIKGDGRGKLADLIVRPDGKSQCEFISAELVASSVDERKRRLCLENAISRVCGPELAARVQEEVRRQS